MHHRAGAAHNLARAKYPEALALEERVFAYLRRHARSFRTSPTPSLEARPARQHLGSYARKAHGGSARARSHSPLWTQYRTPFDRIGARPSRSNDSIAFEGSNVSTL